MGFPLMLVVVGQQIFRVAATAAAKKAVKKVGGKIVKKVPEEFKKKKVKDEFAFQKLFLEKEPTFAERIGNLFVRKPKKVRTDSPGRTNVDEGIVTGQTRTGGFGRGEQVKGAGKGAIGATAVVGGTGVVAIQKLKDRLAKAKVDLKKAKTEEMKATERANIESLLRQLQKAENKKTSSMSKVRPKLRPEERSGNSRGGMIDYRKTGLFK